MYVHKIVHIHYIRLYKDKLDLDEVKAPSKS